MSDLLSAFNSPNHLIDLSMDAGDLALNEGLQTSVILSLFTDRRALKTDEIPDGTTNRRGWFGDLLEPVEGDKWGSRLWLLHRQKVTTETMRLAEEYAQESLSWLIEDKITEAIDITAFEVHPRIPGRGSVLGLEVVLHRPSTPAVTYKFNKLWEETA